MRALSASISVAQLGGIEVADFSADSVERRIEHADDFRRLVVDDAAALRVEQHRHGAMSAVARPRGEVEFVELLGPEHGVGDDAAPGRKRPALIAEQPVDDRQLDDSLQPFQLAEDQRAVGPGTGERHVEPVAPRLGLATALARGPRRAVGGDPVAELRVGADEPPGGIVREIPLRAPHAVDHLHRPILPCAVFFAAQRRASFSAAASHWLCARRTCAGARRKPRATSSASARASSPRPRRARSSACRTRGSAPG